MLRRSYPFFLASCLLCILFFMPVWSAAPQAAEARQTAQTPALILVPEAKEGQRGKKLRITARWQNGSDQRSLSAFRFRLTYDPSYLTLTKIEPAAKMSTDDFRSHMTETGAVSVYASTKRPVLLSGGDCCTYVFTVHEDAAVGSASVSVSADQLVAENLEKLADTPAAAVSIPMERLLSGEALLESLVPSAGELTPHFSPEITEYTLQLPYEVTQLTFEAKAKDNAACRVNRKNLKSAGTPTTFVITVTAENGKSKTEYIVTATRAAKSAAGSTGSKSSSGKKSSSGSSKSGTTVTEDTLGNGNGNGGITQYGDRIIYYNENTYSVFIIGGLCCAVCALAILLVWFVHRKGHSAEKKQNRSPEEKKK